MEAQIPISRGDFRRKPPFWSHIVWKVIRNIFMIAVWLVVKMCTEERMLEAQDDDFIPVVSLGFDKFFVIKKIKISRCLFIFLGSDLDSVRHCAEYLSSDLINFGLHYNILRIQRYFRHEVSYPCVVWQYINAHVNLTYEEPKLIFWLPVPSNLDIM